ncbi:MAG: hypothetical protein FWE84_03040 [Firmicutes bacterium]|nr:hypothetical protein [Bacillota bacterium]
MPKLEGRLKELLIESGNIIQDNNFLQTSKTHQSKVFEMLKGQKAICFKGGLEANLITTDFAEQINGLYYIKGGKKVSRVAELWLACDTDGAIPHFKRAVAALKRTGFTRYKIKCYVLIGDDMDKNEVRLREIYNEGVMPFAQLYQPIDAEKKKEYSTDWKAFHRMWSRPAATRAHMEKGTSFRYFNK